MIKRIIKHEGTIVIIGIIGLILAGSDAIEPVWPWNCLLGALLLALAGLIAVTARCEGE